MKDEYIIINKTVIKQRIEELEDERDGFIYNPNKTEDSICYNSKIDILKQILSQSTPLIPEIEEAMNAAREIQDDSADDTFTAEDISGCAEVCTYGWRYKTINKDYISNLKLDI